MCCAHRWLCFWATVPVCSCAHECVMQHKLAAWGCVVADSPADICMQGQDNTAYYVWWGALSLSSLIFSHNSSSLHVLFSTLPSLSSSFLCLPVYECSLDSWWRQTERAKMAESGSQSRWMMDTAKPKRGHWLESAAQYGAAFYNDHLSVTLSPSHTFFSLLSLSISLSLFFPPSLLARRGCFFTAHHKAECGRSCQPGRWSIKGPVIFIFYHLKSEQNHGRVI